MYENSPNDEIDSDLSRYLQIKEVKITSNHKLELSIHITWKLNELFFNFVE